MINFFKKLLGIKDKCKCEDKVCVTKPNTESPVIETPVVDPIVEAPTEAPIVDEKPAKVTKAKSDKPKVEKKKK